MNYGKLAMLHQMTGCKPIVVYSSGSQDDVQKLYRHLQRLCSGSNDLKLDGNFIVTGNPMLAHTLQEIVSVQTMVSPDDGKCKDGLVRFF